MARKAKIDGRRLIELCDTYIAHELDGGMDRFSIPGFGRWLRENGTDIADYLIRRNEEFRAYIEKRRTESGEEKYSTVSVYRDLDAEQFLRKNNSRDSLKSALMTRDSYYREVSESAAYCFRKYKEMKSEFDAMKEKEETSRIKCAELENSLKETRKENARLKKDLAALRDIVTTYVYPEIANELLARTGFIDNTMGIADVESIDRHTIKADTDMGAIRNKAVSSLLKGFGNDGEN